ncbi:MAG: fatty acid--CoA ligase [Rhodocyclaceae bacterium]|nr:fatty acid--CoA ligase [Rhodocyclaceae bacterium]
MKSAEKIVVTPSAYAYPLLIKQLLHTPLAIAPDQEIVYADQLRYTYRDFHGRVQRFGGLIDRLHLEGETIAVMDWDSHRYLEAFFAVPMSGSVLQTVNIRLAPDQILYTLNHAKARAVFVNAEFLPVLKAIRDKLETVHTFVLLSDDAQAAVPDGFAGEYEALLAASPARFDFPDFDENTRATTFYTTGTTGLPKGVYFSHRQLVLHTMSLLGIMGIAPQQGSFHRDDVYMPLTPMFHVHAWGFPYAATLAGVKQVYPGRYVPDTLIKLIETEKVTFSHCVPTIMHMLLSSPAAEKADLKGWKVIVGGSALPTALAKAALERGIDIFTGYGMSETCPILSLAHVETADLGDDDTAVRTKTGRPNLLVDLRTVTPEMTDLPHDGKSVGEVVVRAPWLTQGYLDNPVASESLWQGGWLHTQDIGHIDARGYLQVTDRIKDVIKTGGEWVSSLEIEDIIGRHPAVAEVAVIGVKDEKWGERPLAMIVLKPGQSADAAAIAAHVKAYAEQGHISKYGVPDQIRFVDSLARTSVGKLNKRAMREALS